MHNGIMLNTCIAPPLGTSEKCFLCVICSILSTIHEPSLSLSSLPYVLEMGVSIVLPRLLTFMDSSASLIFPSQIPGTLGLPTILPHYHYTAITPFKRKKP